MRSSYAGKLGLDGWMQSVQDGDWLRPLRDSARALNANAALMTWTGAGESTALRLGLHGTKDFAQFCSEISSQAGAEVCGRSGGAA